MKAMMRLAWDALFLSEEPYAEMRECSNSALRGLGLVVLVALVVALAGLVATVWGIAIYVKALAVANGFSISRAIVATGAPALAGGTLALLGLLGFLILALASG